MDNLTLVVDPDGTTTRTFKPVSERNNIVTLETRDQTSRSLESSMILSSTHLDSGATKVAAKVLVPVIKTIDGSDTNVGQNMMKLELIVSDEAPVSDRESLAILSDSLATALKPFVHQLEPVLA